MGLAQSQRLLARLATDARLRARFLDDPERVCAEFGLSTADADRFRALPPGQLDDFGRSLIRKRLGEVESLLPMTSRVLGPGRLAGLFRQHALDYVPIEIKKHRDDALAFAEFLEHRAEGAAWWVDLARFEAASLLAHDPTVRWLPLRLRHHPADLARSSVVEGSPTASKPIPRPTWVIWFRASTTDRVRRLILARPW